jgi:ABC-2 type transport system ATP-binding protein
MRCWRSKGSRSPTPAGSHSTGSDLTVEAGEICGLLGPNGAGKTTLVSIIAGLRVADRGRVLLDGAEVSSGAAAVRSIVGLAGQETAIYPTVTVRDNLVLFADLAGLRGARRAARISEIASVLELEALLDRLGRHLSGGEKRRVHTAMALVHRPRVVLLDEPTTGVDVGTRQRLLAAVRRFASEDGSAVVYSTHYLPEIEQLDASVVVLDHGRVLARGRVAELVRGHGRGSVEITLSCDPPDVHGAEVEHGATGGVLRLRGDQPGILLATAMAELGPRAERVVAVDVLQPSLESVFLKLTGCVPPVSTRRSSWWARRSLRCSPSPCS